MNGKITIEVNLVDELEEMTNYAPDSYIYDWRPIDTERLKRIVEYLDRHASNETVSVDMRVDDPGTPIVSDRI